MSLGRYAKRRYPSQQHAESCIVEIQRKRPGYLRAFPCPSCGGFHLTHQQPRLNAYELGEEIRLLEAHLRERGYAL